MKGIHFLPAFVALNVLCMPFAYSQNLVPNYSFEDYKSCPSSFGGSGEMDCEPWFNANQSTCDYYNACSIVWVCDVPANYVGAQDPITGVAYAGFLARSNSPPNEWYEYPEIQLIQPLDAGRAYHVKFWVSKSGLRGCAVQKLGAYLQQGPVNDPGTGPLDVIPQIESNSGWINDTVNWTLIEGCFLAEGGEDHIVIGNFQSFANSPLEPCTAWDNMMSYYYLENVSVEEVQLEGLDLEVGDDVTVCYEYTIEPDAPADVNYLWSTGSTEPAITVSETGWYKLTIYDGCLGAKDSVYVTILNQPPVAINPDTVICPDVPLLVMLDPDAGEYEWDDGSNASTYIINEAGTYSVTLDDGCDLTSDEIEVEVLDPPALFSLGTDTILCPGTEIEFEFDPDLGEFTWQDGSHDNAILIYQPGEYALTISNMCGESAASVVVELLDPQPVNLGPASEIFCTGDFLDINLEDEYATYVWQDGSTDPDYHITDPGIYSVTMMHVCGVSQDSIVIVQVETPNIELGNAINACPGDIITLSVNNPSSIFTWQDGSTNDTLLVTGTGDYAVTVENTCGTDSDTIHVEFEDHITAPELGPDFFLCPGEQAVLFSGQPTANHLWQDGSTLDSFIVSAAGIYHVTVSNTCFSFIDSVEVVVNDDPPAILLPGQIVLCHGEIETLDPGVKGVSFLWSDGTTNSILNISNPGLYSLTISNACGSDIDTVNVLDGGPSPFVALGSDTSLCPGAAISFNPVFSDVDTWLWQDGSSSNSYIANDSGFVHVIVSNSCGSNEDSLYISLLPPEPVLQLANDTAICAGESVDLIIANTEVDILWSDGSTNPALTITNPGIYFAVVSNSCGKDSDTMELSQLPAIPGLDLGPDLPLCPGEIITINPGISDVNYVWQDGSTDTVYEVVHNQVVSLSISNECGVSFDTLEIFISTDGPNVELGEDLLVCEGEVVTIQSNISGVEYEWQDGSTASEFTTSVSGTYYVQVSNSCGIDSDTIEVVVDGLLPAPDLGSDTTLCEGKTFTLVSNADAETTIEWQDGTSGSVFVVNSAGLYILHEVNHCGEKTDSIVVDYLALPPAIDLGPDVTLCPGDSIILEAPVTSETLSWHDGSTDPFYSAAANGIYSLMISNECGTRYDEMILTYDERLQLPEEDEVVFCPGDSAELNVQQTIHANYSWSTGSSLPSITVGTPGVYAVTIITECQDANHAFVVSLKADCEATNEIYIPNVFSPNGDNVNDLFSIFTNDKLEILSIDGSIFDRWGDLVYQSTEMPFDWDGTFDNQDVMPGVYVYTIVMVYKVNNQVIRERFTGDVTMVK